SGTRVHHTPRVRFALVVLIACTASHPAVRAPGLRLPGGVTPLAYQLRIEIDPMRDTFRGSVRIRTRIEAPTDHVWIHSDELDIARATFEGGALVALPVAGEQMRAFGFGRTVAAGEVTLAFEYTGYMKHDQEGVFRQLDRDHWYAFTQAESTLARRITP